MQRIFSSFIHARERASRLTATWPPTFSLFFTHHRCQPTHLGEPIDCLLARRDRAGVWNLVRLEGFHLVLDALDSLDKLLLGWVVRRHGAQAADSELSSWLSKATTS